MSRVSVLPREVAERLAALERRVEEAFGHSGDAGGDLGRALDGTLAAVATLRRTSLGDALDGLRLIARRRLGDGAGARVAPAAEAMLAAAYRWWWRVETVGLERVPATGRVLLAVNRSGAPLPYEGLMITRALAAMSRSDARVLLDDWLGALPVIGDVLAQVGGVRPASGAVRRLLARDEAVVLFPEGDDAVAKPWSRRYRLGSFGKASFARAAIQTGAPIVPVAVIGAEEMHPVLTRLDGAGRLLGLPTLPVTPTFPWLGAAGLVPLPTKWTVHFGEPLDVAARWTIEDASRPAAVRQVRDLVRERLQALVLEGLRRRQGVFFAS